MGDRRLALYCSAEAHYSVVRAAEVLGLGAEAVRTIRIGRHRAMDAAACAAAIDAQNYLGDLVHEAASPTHIVDALEAL